QIVSWIVLPRLAVRVCPARSPSHRAHAPPSRAVHQNHKNCSAFLMSEIQCLPYGLPKGYALLPKGDRYLTLHGRKRTLELGKDVYIVIVSAPFFLPGHH